MADDEGALLLHAALEAKRLDLNVIRSLAARFPGASCAKNSRGSTPLMLAANGKGGKRSNSKLVDILLEYGAIESLAEVDSKGRTAVQIAKERPCPPLATRLTLLEENATTADALASASTEGVCIRCTTCRKKLRKGQTKLETLGDRVRRGQENNRLLHLFYCQSTSSSSPTKHDTAATRKPHHVEELARPQFHRVNSCVAFRKELTESMALVDALRTMRKNNNNDNKNADHGNVDVETEDYSWKKWQLIDLCCGSSLTSALCLTMLKDVVVTPCDILDEINLPHYKQAGYMEDRVSYLQHDITTPDFITRLKEEYLRPNHKYIVLGMHCCGELSLRALEIYDAINADAAFLVPCCFPSKSSGVAPEVFAVKGREQQEMYRIWGEHILKVALALGDGNDGYMTRVEDVISQRNLLLRVQKSCASSRAEI